MTTVLDAYVLVAALVGSVRASAWANSVVADKTLAGPELVLFESGNILRRLERAHKISRVEATTMCRDLLPLDLTLYPLAPFAERVWELQTNLTCYDAWHVALAEAPDRSFVALDLKLGRADGRG